MATTAHPQTDGQAEGAIGIWEQIARTFLNVQGDDWARWFRQSIANARRALTTHIDAQKHAGASASRGAGGSAAAAATAFRYIKWTDHRFLVKAAGDTQWRRVDEAECARAINKQ